VTILPNYHIGRVVLGSMCVGDSLWLGGVVTMLQASACKTDTHRETAKSANTRVAVMFYVFFSTRHFILHAKCHFSLSLPYPVLCLHH